MLKDVAVGGGQLRACLPRVHAVFVAGRGLVAPRKMPALVHAAKKAIKNELQRAKQWKMHIYPSHIIFRDTCPIRSKESKESG